MPKWLEFTIQLLPVGVLILAGIFFLARLESDNDHLQKDVSELQKDVSELQVSINNVSTGVGEVKANQQRILDTLDSIKVGLRTHVHEADGTVWVLPTSNRVTLPSY